LAANTRLVAVSSALPMRPVRAMKKAAANTSRKIWAPPGAPRRTSLKKSGPFGRQSPNTPKRRWFSRVKMRPAKITAMTAQEATVARAEPAVPMADSPQPPKMSQ